MTMGSNLSNMRILVIEDEYYIARDAGAALESLGAEVIGPVGAPEDAVDLIRREGAGLSAALIDIKLQGERSFAAIEAAEASGLPYALMTGYAGEDIPESFRHAPRCEKPLDPKRIVETVSSICRRS
jgi:DNA-binding NtrC family response regulator